MSVPNHYITRPMPKALDFWLSGINQALVVVKTFRLLCLNRNLVYDNRVNLPKMRARDVLKFARAILHVLKGKNCTTV
jgi:hypothetical protein